MKRIYLDHTATTPVDPAVLEAMTAVWGPVFGNPSSAHWHGRQAKAALEEARATIARAIGAQPAELFFTSGGTEANNLAILGTAAAAHMRRRIVTVGTEHHAVLDTCEHLARNGMEVVVLPVDAHGCVGMDRLDGSLTDGTALVSVMHANNEVGTIHPVRAIADRVHERGAVIHTDAVQSVGKIAVDVRELGVDLLSLSGHKIHGPKGIGALFIRRGVDIEPLQHGGGQERGKRPGTENVALAVGLAEAVRLAVAARDQEMVRLRTLRDRLENEIRRLFPGVIVNGHPVDRLPQLLSISFDAAMYPMEGEMLITNLDLEGISVSSGSACTSGSVQPSHVLMAMGRDEATAKATVRFSFGRANTDGDIPVVAEALRSVVDRMLSRR